MDVTLIYGYGFSATCIDDRTNAAGMKAVAERYGFAYERFLFAGGFRDLEDVTLSEFLDAMKNEGAFETSTLPLSYDEMDGTAYLYFKVGLPWDTIPGMPSSYEEADQVLNEFLDLLFNGQEYDNNYGEIADASFC